jgi:hypothetical protein
VGLGVCSGERRRLSRETVLVALREASRDQFQGVPRLKFVFAQRYFVAYEATKEFLTPVGAKKEDLNFGAIVAAGGMAGIAMWTIAIPPDVSLVCHSRWKALKLFWIVAFWKYR